MADLGEFHELSKVTREHRPCRIGAVLTELGKQDRENLELALDAGQDTVPARTILAWLRKRGYDDFASAWITTHRMGKCRCAALKVLNG